VQALCRQPSAVAQSAKKIPKHRRAASSEVAPHPSFICLLLLKHSLQRLQTSHTGNLTLMDAMRLAHRYAAVCSYALVLHLKRCSVGRGAVVDVDGSAHFVHDLKLQCGNAFPASVSIVTCCCATHASQFTRQEEHVLDSLRQLQCPLLFVLGTKGWCVCSSCVFLPVTAAAVRLLLRDFVVFAGALTLK
jgi:hypothetical protein